MMISPTKAESDQLVDNEADAVEARDRASSVNYLQLTLPLSLTVGCAVCGAPFEISRRRGRPERFCSDACRGMQHRQQKAKWGKNNSVVRRRSADEASETT
jgi:hypothetical protein